MNSIICHKISYSILLFFCVAAFCYSNLSAQLMLKNTTWTSVSNAHKGDHINLQFDADSFYLKTRDDNKLIFKMTFTQNHDTLLVNPINLGKVKSANRGFYQINYTNNGQNLFFNIITGDGADLNRFLNVKIIFSYIPINGYPVRDWYFRDINDDSIPGISLYKAYKLLKGKTPHRVVVAVIDNGIDINQEDLKNVIWKNTKEIPGNGIDDDNNGYIDDVNGWNFRGAKDGTTPDDEQSAETKIYSMWKNKYDNADTSILSEDDKKEWKIYTKAKKQYLENIKDIHDSTEIKYVYNLDYNSSRIIGDNPLDPNQHFYGSPIIKLTPKLTHGTHVAGIIAGQRNNNIGIDGVADNVLIMPIVASTGGGDERDKDVANAIRYAADNGAKIINLSFSKRFSPYKKVVDEAIRHAEEKNVLIIHAAGNDGENNDSLSHYPIAEFDNGEKANNFIEVGWIKPMLNERLVAYYSDYGTNTVDLLHRAAIFFQLSLKTIMKRGRVLAMRLPLSAAPQLYCSLISLPFHPNK